MKWKEEISEGFHLEPGIYNAVCDSLIDLGVQTDEWQGKKKVRSRCIIGWELLDELYEKDGESHRMHFSQVYTQSLHPKATLRKHLNGWRGRDFTAEELEGFEAKNILGKPCVLVIGLTETGKPTVQSISRYKGDPVKAEKVQEFSFDEFQGKFPDWMGDGLIAWCCKSQEYQDYLSKGAEQEESYHATETEEEDNLPF